MSLQINSAVSVNTPSIASLLTPQAASRPASSGLQAMLAAEYSTRAGGQTWSANIEPFAGEYVATVPNLPGATAAGLTVAQVEDTLSYLISFFA